MDHVVSMSHSTPFEEQLVNTSEEPILSLGSTSPFLSSLALHDTLGSRGPLPLVSDSYSWVTPWHLLKAELGDLKNKCRSGERGLAA